MQRNKKQGYVLKEFIITNTGSTNISEVMIPKMSGCNARIP